MADEALGRGRGQETLELALRPVGVEAPRWPVAYSVAMTLAGAPPSAAGAGGPLAFRFNPGFAEELFAGSGHGYRELLDLAGAGKLGDVRIRLDAE